MTQLTYDPDQLADINEKFGQLINAIKELGIQNLKPNLDQLGLPKTLPDGFQLGQQVRFHPNRMMVDDFVSNFALGLSLGSGPDDGVDQFQEMHANFVDRGIKRLMGVAP